MHCKTSSLVRITFCGIHKNGMESDFFVLLTQYVVPPKTTAVVGLEPSYHPANNQGSKSCVYCYQSFAPVNSGVCTIIFTKITLLLKIYLTYLKNTSVWFVALQIPCVLPQVFGKMKQPSKNTFVLELWEKMTK